MTVLDKIKQETASLTLPEKEQLAAFLKEQLNTAENGRSAKGQDSTNGEGVRLRRMHWFKTHRDEYGGQYVALDADRLIAVGSTYREARENALAAGVHHPFVTYLSKPDEVAEWGGW